MVTSSYEWNTLEWDEKTNKQTLRVLSSVIRRNGPFSRVVSQQKGNEKTHDDDDNDNDHHHHNHHYRHHQRHRHDFLQVNPQQQYVMELGCSVPQKSLKGRSWRALLPLKTTSKMPGIYNLKLSRKDLMLIYLSIVVPWRNRLIFPSFLLLWSAHFEDFS